MSDAARIAELEKALADTDLARVSLANNLARTELTLAEAQRARERGESQLSTFWSQLFPNYAWSDARTAVDLMAAEITATRTERDTLRGLLREARDSMARSLGTHRGQCECDFCQTLERITAALKESEWTNAR